MSVTLDRLFADPTLYFHSIDGDHARFVQMTRDDYRNSIFFDRRIKRPNDIIYRVPLGLLLEATEERVSAPPRLNFIHHVAQCGSTLLARALDGDGGALGIREPFALRQVAVQVGAGGRPTGGSWSRLLRFVLAMLGKRFDGASSVVVKGNVPISMIAGRIDALDPGQAGILLHFPLDDYLAAVLRTTGHGQWVDAVAAEIRLADDPRIGSVEGMATPQRAAALWLSLVGHYAALLDSNPQMRSLDANQLFDRPGETIAAAAALFAVPMTKGEAEAIASGPLFDSYGKNPDQPYDPGQRIERREQTRREHADELAAARRWVEGRLDEFPLPRALANPLLGEPAPLL